MTLGDDPHFSVALPSNRMLCYTIQGDHHKTYNLLSNSRMQINALFVPDSHRKEVTWIGSLGFVFCGPDENLHSKTSSPKANTTIKLSAKGSRISINSKANFSAKNIASISVKNGKCKITEAEPVEGFRYPYVYIRLEDAGISFSVMFKREHLDLFWHSTQVQRQASHGLIGQLELIGSLTSAAPFNSRHNRL